MDEGQMWEKPGRTFELWLLALGLLVISLVGWLRLQFVISAWEFLRQTGFEPGPAYQAILGAVWGVGGLACAASLLLRRPWAPTFTRVTVLVLEAWYWIDYLALTRAPDAAQNWPYMLVLSVLGAAFAFGVLALNRQKRFFAAH
jgi:hypothetical protein